MISLLIKKNRDTSISSLMKPLIIANWKCNPTSLYGAKLLFNSVKRGVKDIKNVEVVICPPFVYIPKLTGASAFAKGFGGLAFGSQDCFWENSGAFTGEISPQMLKNLGCQYVILGHSERRQHLKETDEMINKKLKAVLKEKLNPILCIGETAKERESGKTFQVLKNQLQKGIENCKLKIENLILAYEPVWAIGTGKACSPIEAEKASNFIRKVISQIYNQKIAKNIRILYGGSVNSQNASSYIFEANFQGLLVGGASLKPKEFVKIIKSIANY